MTLRERLKAVTNNFAWEQDWNIQEHAVHKRDIDYRRGKADAYGDVVHRLDEVLEGFPEEAVVKDKLTLTELARELRKIFRFKYLTVDKDSCHYPHPVIEIWDVYPEYKEIPTVKDEYWNPSQETRCWDHGNYVYSGKFCLHSLTAELDLSEYADENGEIDYSRCIVEVSDDAE